MPLPAQKSKCSTYFNFFPLAPFLSYLFIFSFLLFTCKLVCGLCAYWATLQLSIGLKRLQAHTRSTLGMSWKKIEKSGKEISIWYFKDSVYTLHLFIINHKTPLFIRCITSLKTVFVEHKMSYHNKCLHKL